MLRWCYLPVLVACGDEPTPVTRFIHSDAKTFDLALQRHARGAYFHAPRGLFDPSSPAPAQYTNHGRLAWFLGTEPKLARVTTFDVWITGYREAGNQFVTPCRLQIGPNPVRRPIPIDFLFDLFENDELGERMREAVGPFDIEKRYLFELQHEGFWIHLEQFPDHTIPNVELVIDGCRRIPTERTARYEFEQLTFEPVEALP